MRGDKQTESWAPEGGREAEAGMAGSSDGVRFPLRREALVLTAPLAETVQLESR